LIFVDANIFMYAAGKESPQRAACRGYLERWVQDPSQNCLCTNTEVLQEILHRYRAIGVPEMGMAIFDSLLAMQLSILPVCEEDLRVARLLLEEHPALSTRDAVHVGVMLNAGIDQVLSYDRDFDRLLPKIQRLLP